jgi:hypothetical protein
LVTTRPPSERVRRFANRVLSYLYHIVRYLTYNEPELPFPFSDFPPQLEPIGQGETTKADEVAETLEGAE